MKRAILDGDVRKIGELAERDNLSLHATSMTAERGCTLMEPETLRVIRKVEKLRKTGFSIWFSLDTGPSVFINTVQENLVSVSEQTEQELGLKTIRSGVGGPPQISTDHLF